MTLQLSVFVDVHDRGTALLERFPNQVGAVANFWLLLGAHDGNPMTLAQPVFKAFDAFEKPRFGANEVVVWPSLDTAVGIARFIGRAPPNSVAEKQVSDPRRINGAR